MMTSIDLSPALTDAITKILAIAAQAAMQGKSDKDLLIALEAIQGEIRAAEMEYHGDMGYQPTPVELDSMAASDASIASRLALAAVMQSTVSSASVTHMCTGKNTEERSSIRRVNDAAAASLAVLLSAARAGETSDRAAMIAINFLFIKTLLVLYFRREKSQSIVGHPPPRSMSLLL